MKLEYHNQSCLCFAPGNKNQKTKAKSFVSQFALHTVISFLPVGFKFYQQTRFTALRGLARRSNKSKWGVIRHLNLLLLEGQYNWCRHYFETHESVGVVWNGLKSERLVFALACKHAGRPIVYLEESPIPHTLTVDTIGVNYKNSLPRYIDFYLKWQQENQNPSKKWQDFAPRFVTRKPKSPNHDHASQYTNIDHDSKYLFCPLQVPKDSQILYFSDYVKTIDQYIEILHSTSKYLPNGWHLRIKEHPSSDIKFTQKLIGLQNERFKLDNFSDTFEQVKQSKGIVTINSSLGLQAMFFRKPVIVLGKAFYNFPPITYHAQTTLQLGQLMANPNHLEWREQETTAFLNYLINCYYIFEPST